MYEKTIKLGQHGFVRYVDHMGTDASIVQAARVSYGDGTKTVSEDTALIEYLLRNGHTSPFEMLELKLHIKATVFEARQIVRHRTASWNEVSGRYSVLANEFWVPEDVRAQSTKNKQCSEGEVENPGLAKYIINVANIIAYEAYKLLLSMGVGREQARAVLPVSMYTEWYWKIDGNNLMKFLALREDGHAQAETQAVARAIREIATDLWPGMMAAYEECIVGGGRFTRTQLNLLRELLCQEYPAAMSLEEVLAHRMTEANIKLKSSLKDEFIKVLCRGQA